MCRLRSRCLGEIAVLLAARTGLDIDDERVEHRAVAKLKRSSVFTFSKQRKISAALGDFVAPVLAMTPGAPLETIREIISIAVLVWNAVLLEQTEGTDFLSDVRARIESLREPRGHEFLSALIEDLADRKRNEFGGDQRLIGQWEIVREPGGFRVRAEARALSSRKP